MTLDKVICLDKEAWITGAGRTGYPGPTGPDLRGLHVLLCEGADEWPRHEHARDAGPCDLGEQRLGCLSGVSPVSGVFSRRCSSTYQLFR